MILYQSGTHTCVRSASRRQTQFTLESSSPLSDSRKKTQRLDTQIRERVLYDIYCRAVGGDRSEDFMVWGDL